MTKLVILNQSMTGRTFDLNVERTTVGRIEENTFQIADPSISSRHAEILLRGSDVLVRDLNSTNGTFINGEKITEAVLRPGQTLRLGQVELKIDDGQPVAAPAPAAARGPEAAEPRKSVDSTMIIPRGVNLNELGEGGTRTGFNANKDFSKKTNQANRYFIIIGILVGLVIIGLIIFALKQTGASR